MADLIFLAHRMPLPEDKGGDARSWRVLRHLAERHRVHLGCFVQGSREIRQSALLQEICASFFCAPNHPAIARVKGLSAFMRREAFKAPLSHDIRLARWIAGTIAQQRPIGAFASSPAMAAYLEDYRFETRVIDMVEVESAKWRHRAECSQWPLNELYWNQERALLALETRAASRFDHTLFASAAEAHLFMRRAPRAPARIAVMRNGVDADFFSPDQGYANPYSLARKSVVFAGALNYPPNIEGVTWFATEVMTMLRHRFPTIDFWIVGQHPARAVRTLAYRDVHIARGIADPRRYLAHADAVVVPLRIGRGIENGVLEGMAMAKPVIATPAALDGFDFVNGEEVFCSASAAGFASAVAAALGGRAAEMGGRARQRVLADHGWATTLGRLDEVFAPSKSALASAS